MTFEKFGKAALARTDAGAFRKWRFSHVAGSRFFQTLVRGHPKLSLDRNEVKTAINAIKALERAHPATARGGPHLEYPWEDEDGVRDPGDHQVVLELSDPMSAASAALLFRFASDLDKKFDDIIA